MDGQLTAEERAMLAGPPVATVTTIIMEPGVAFAPVSGGAHDDEHDPHIRRSGPI